VLPSSERLSQGMAHALDSGKDFALATVFLGVSDPIPVFRVCSLR
jgi:hypothetical protein